MDGDINFIFILSERQIHDFYIYHNIPNTTAWTFFFTNITLVYYISVTPSELKKLLVKMYSDMQSNII